MCHINKIAIYKKKKNTLLSFAYVGALLSYQVTM